MSAKRAAPWPVSSDGTYAAKNWAPTWPSPSRAMSVMSESWGSEMSSESRFPPTRTRSSNGRSLWPSISGIVPMISRACARAMESAGDGGVGSWAESVAAARRPFAMERAMGRSIGPSYYALTVGMQTPPRGWGI